MTQVLYLIYIPYKAMRSFSYLTMFFVIYNFAIKFHCLDPTTESETETEPTATTARSSRSVRQAEPLFKNGSTIVLSYAPNLGPNPSDYDLTLHYDSNDPINYYNYAKSGASPPQVNFNMGEFLPAQHRVAESPDIEEKEVYEPFHINSFEKVQAPFKIYNTILRYAHIDNIKSSILELPLDSENYNLLILLPDLENNLDAVMNAMRNDYSVNLRQLRRRLRPHWIKTIVPKFHQQGNIVLTGDLMKVLMIACRSRINHLAG